MADLATGLEIGGELIGSAIKLIGGLVDTYGADDPQVQGITSSLYTLLGAEAASEIAQRLGLEAARKAAAEVQPLPPPAAPEVPAVAPVPVPVPAAEVPRVI